MQYFDPAKDRSGSNRAKSGARVHNLIPRYLSHKLSSYIGWPRARRGVGGAAFGAEQKVRGGGVGLPWEGSGVACLGVSSSRVPQNSLIPNEPPRSLSASSNSGEPHETPGVEGEGQPWNRATPQGGSFGRVGAIT